ncbi:glycosyltransferase family 39 protein [Flagellimonas sp. HMM57]|uniref:glycosyltransferase family 39 protein n=1 Tax=unclassified Flagellimonas TaxID=2644544 RepID=UPI0013D65F59|nr:MULTISPECIES: glycosyltransferase family 39 protein [unclassified Flagellimonas]UII76385.1 glycosyltransferase family 39 protein [Flagellimonas sp. HMM57]
MLTRIKGLPLEWGLALVSFIAIIFISYLKTSLELEDAEQAYYSQWWRLGYDDQPPLYTWLQKVVNAIFGVTKFSFSFLRGIFFAATLLALYEFGRKVLRDRFKAQLVVLSSALIPVFIDFTFRRLSHTLLLCLVILLTFNVIARLIEKKSSHDYILLGICFGIGMLSKYNYAFFLLAVMVTSLFDLTIKRVFWNKRILISYSIAIILFLPHLYWYTTTAYLQNVQESLYMKLGTEGDGTIIFTPFLETIKAIFEISAPFVLVVILLRLLKMVHWQTTMRSSWLFKLMIAQLLVLMVCFTLMDVKEVQTRWLLPLLLPYLVVFIESIDIDKENVRKGGIVLFILIIAFQVLRTPIERFLGIPSAVHFDYGYLSKKLNTNYANAVWVLPNVTYGGQIRLLHPEKELLTLDDFSIPNNKKKDDSLIIVSTLKNTFENLQPKDSILNYGPEKESLYFFEKN